MIANNGSEMAMPLHALGHEVAELSLLLPSWQLGALEQVAEAEGITVGQLLRRAVNRTLMQLDRHQPGYYHG